MYHFDLINSPLKVSPHGSFKVIQLCESVAICEATNGDRFNLEREVRSYVAVAKKNNNNKDLKL